MFKRLLQVLVGVRSSPAPAPPPAPQGWREPPMATVKNEIADGLVSEISYVTGPHGFVNVVGELAYQDTLRHLPRLFTAKLVLEPDNPHDANAVAVKTEDDRTVGYLARGVAVSYQPHLLQQLAPVRCPAKLTGGEGSKTHIGVVLDFEVVRQTLGLPLMAVDRGPLDYAAVAEYHRINRAARNLVKATRRLERTDLAAAERLYRQALAMIHECHALASARGPLPHGFLPNQTDTVALERLVICLIKSGRQEDAVSEIEAYCEMFPHANEMKLLATTRARVARVLT